jgi:hypothetical protein
VTIELHVEDGHDALEVAEDIALLEGSELIYLSERPVAGRSSAPQPLGCRRHSFIMSKRFGVYQAHKRAAEPPVVLNLESPASNVNVRGRFSLWVVNERHLLT